VTLDIATLFVVTVFTLGVSGVLLLFTWLQNRETRALAWWGATFLLYAAAAALFGGRGTLGEVWSIQFADALLLLGYGMMWTGARVFEGRKPLLPVAAFGAAIWLVACQVEGFLPSDPARVLLATGVIWAYGFLFIRELWLGRHEQLMSRWPVMAIVLLHALLFPLRIPAVLAMQFPLSAAPNSFAGTVTIFAPLFYAFALVFLLMALTKERAELRQRQAATHDPLTGIPNRRGFSERAQRVVARLALGRTPLTLLVFDLDNFKNINDRFGHRTGDRVLTLFSDCATQSLRPLDLLGRMGGDEFVALLPGVTPEIATGIAERVRDAFAGAAQEVDGHPVAATVSIGIAAATQSGFDFDALYASADAALYRAKRNGRNRIEPSRLAPEAPPQRNERLMPVTAGT
jgi:diguanylate cyclase (GGDEF)-like protein